MPRWRDKKRFEELENLTSYVQDLLDANYKNRSHHNKFKFEPEGQNVVILAHGLYYQATTMSYYRLNHPETLYTKGEVVPVEDRVITYRLCKTGWPNPIKNQEELSENEIISCELDDSVAVIGMLSAHLWNIWKQNEMGFKDQDRYKMGPGVWFLDSEEYKQLESLWQKNSKETISFNDFCIKLQNLNLNQT